MTDKEIIKALRELEAESQCLCICDGCHEDDCVTPLFRSAANMIEQLTAENTALRKKIPQWINCKDELPPLEQEVLIRTKWRDIYNRRLHKYLDGVELFTPGGLEPINGVTHWMPLPEAPEGTQ